mmetsp:Transcript_32316/g.47798  ORF Transcript_32316/g.47798 Transcript_32316/m.47798 type:complete len:120 (-) Transcript_32316:1349-1708(-)
MNNEGTNNHQNWRQNPDEKEYSHNVNYRDNVVYRCLHHGCDTYYFDFEVLSLFLISTWYYLQKSSLILSIVNLSCTVSNCFHLPYSIRNAQFETQNSPLAIPAISHSSVILLVIYWFQH